eukprot:g6822.t1
MPPDFPTVDVSISSRKILAHWVRLGRQVLKEAWSDWHRSGAGDSSGSGKEQMHSTTSLLSIAQEELERMCLEDPEELIHCQIELLTRRIMDLEDELLRQFRSAEKAKAAEAEAAAKRAAERAAELAKRAAQVPKKSAVQQAREARAQEDLQIMDWDTVFDRAVAKREHWKKNRGQQEDMAHQQWRKNLGRPKRSQENWCISVLILAVYMILHDDKHVCVFSLRKAVMRQPTLASEDAKAGKSQVAEQLRKERENLQDRKRKEELRRQAAELERQRLEEEERRREEEERDRQALERLKREKQESERRRAEERRLAAEREEQQRKDTGMALGRGWRMG